MIGGNQFVNQQEVMDASRLREGDVVADLGCGSGGYFTIPFAEKVGVTGTVYAVDILQSALHTIQTVARSKNLTNISLIYSNLEKAGATKIPEASLDVAYLINMLFQNSDKKTVLQEADRFLKAGGILTLVDWRSSAKGFGPTQELLVDRTIVADLFGQRYELVNSENLGRYHFVDVYKKLR